jgi:predicted dehydrogenase
MIDTKIKPRLNLALIGCGRIAQSHLEAIARNPACRLQAVIDVREEAAQSVATRFGGEAFTDYRRALQSNDLDAAIICTPPATHAEVALFFLEHGVHVLCEKPLALRAEQAARMAAKAEEKSCLLMMASKFRYADAVIKAKGMIASGLLGEIILFENVFCSKVDMRERWNAQREISGGGVLIDNGCHSVDIARYLLGPITKVQAEEGKRMQPLKVEDTARLYFRTASEAMGTIDLSWSIHKERESYIDVFGDEGVLSIGWKGAKYRLNRQPDWTRFGEGYDKSQAFGRQLENFAGAIQGKEEPLISTTDALESVKVIEAAYKSMRMNKWIAVESGARTDYRLAA